MQQPQHKVWLAAGGVPARTPNALLLAPLVLGVAAVMLLANASGAGAALLRRLRPRRRSAGNPNTGEPDLRRLRNSLLGHNQNQVAGLLGPPPTSAGAAPFAADTWYYPIRTRRRYAMAIHFDHGRANSVDFVPDRS
jgi:outer membrane protein assembly factor BamE (lipoprotein component of BamABCDE complex)